MAAAFDAHTRGGWRAAGASAAAGVLAPGAAATFAVWAGTDLVDGLPELAPGAPWPLCLRTVVHGRTAFDIEQ